MLQANYKILLFQRLSEAEFAITKIYSNYRKEVLKLVAESTFSKDA